MLGNIWKHFQKKQKKRETFKIKVSRLIRHCGRWDLNPHANTCTRSLVLPVCQFQHSRISSFQDYVVRKMGLEPTRAKRSQEPESCSSANSDTSAYRLCYASAYLIDKKYYNTTPTICKHFFQVFLKNIFIRKIPKTS